MNIERFKQMNNKFILAFLLVTTVLTGKLNAQSHTHEVKNSCGQTCQHVHSNVEVDGFNCILEGTGKTRKSYIPAPFKVHTKEYTDTKFKNFEVYANSFSDEALEAFEYAVGIWDGIINVSTPIKVYADFSSDLPSTALAGCSPAGWIKDFYGEKYNSSYHPSAIYKKLTNTYFEDQGNSMYFDMQISISATNSYWYYGTDGDTPEDQYDFVTVILHELAHGLGFISLSNGNAFLVTTNVPGHSTYDKLVVDESGSELTGSNFEDLASAFVSPMYFKGDHAKDVYNETLGTTGKNIPLYSPTAFESGSSVSHLDDYFYDNDSVNSLMCRAIDLGRAIHDPGPLLIASLRDIGWDGVDIYHVPTDYDVSGATERSINFSVADQNYSIDPTSIKVYYREGADITDYTTPYTLASTTVGDPYTENDVVKYDCVATLTGLDDNSGDGNLYSYYIQADRIDSDDNNKHLTYYYPSNEINTDHVIPTVFTFGGDTISPEIQSVEADEDVWITYRNTFDVETLVSDNSQVEKVEINFFKDGEAIGTPQSISLNSEESPSYKTIKTFEGSVSLPEGVNAGDDIEYNIIATDESPNANTDTFPSGTTLYSLDIVEFSDLAQNAEYFNDFDELNNDDDFYLQGGMTIDGVSNDFSSNAITTPHPYSLDKDYIATFKKAITLTQRQVLSFDEIALVERRENGIVYPSYFYYDYVVPEYSTDEGLTWEALVDGYDASDNSDWSETWESSGQDDNGNSPAIGNEELYAPRAINLMEATGLPEGTKVLVRIRLSSDSYTTGWGWVADNFRISYDGDLATSINKPESVFDNLVLAPNPASQSFFLNVTEQVRIQIYSLSGSLVRDQYINGGQNVYIGDLNRGIYLVKVFKGTDFEVKKLIKK